MGDRDNTISIKQIKKEGNAIKKTVVLIVVLLIVFPILALAQENERALSGNVHGVFGQKQMDKNDWDPTDDHIEFGLLVDFQPKGWPLSIAFEGLKSEDDQRVKRRDQSVKLTHETTELAFGVKKYFDTNSGFYPFVGGGLALIDVDIKVTVNNISASENDSGFGGWLGGGVIYVIKNFSIGAYLRYSVADVSFSGSVVEAGGFHALGMAGVHF